jgi:flavin-dependent dehydrogenase
VPESAGRSTARDRDLLDPHAARRQRHLGITLYGSSGDQPLKALRDPVKWDRAGAAPARATRTGSTGEPITPVMPMGGVIEPRALGQRRPAPRGLVSLGDAWACTNPSMGRGMALGLATRRSCARVMREHGDTRRPFVRGRTDAELRPWYDSTVLVDRARVAEIIALRNGNAPVASEHIGARVGRALGPP